MSMILLKLMVLVRRWCR